MNEPQQPFPIVIYTAGSLGGEPMTAQQIASGIQGGMGTAGVRGVIQVVEAYAAEAMGMATYENAIRDGAAGPYLMAGSFLTNLLTDLREYAQGKVPAVPVQTRMKPRRPDPEKS